METLANLESFMRSAECGSFSAAARRLGVTPAALSGNVAMLERNRAFVDHVITAFREQNMARRFSATG